MFLKLMNTINTDNISKQLLPESVPWEGLHRAIIFMRVYYMSIMTKRLTLATLTLILIAFICGLTPCHGKNRVFLLGGQSNMAGQGNANELVGPMLAVIAVAQEDGGHLVPGDWPQDRCTPGNQALACQLARLLEHESL